MPIGCAQDIGAFTEAQRVLMSRNRSPLNGNSPCKLQGLETDQVSRSLPGSPFETRYSIYVSCGCVKSEGPWSETTNDRKTPRVTITNMSTRATNRITIKRPKLCK